jgi:hypothetical protein
MTNIPITPEDTTMRFKPAKPGEILVESIKIILGCLFVVGIILTVMGIFGILIV